MFLTFCAITLVAENNSDAILMRDHFMQDDMSKLTPDGQEPVSLAQRVAGDLVAAGGSVLIMAVGSWLAGRDIVGSIVAGLIVGLFVLGVLWSGLLRLVRVGVVFAGYRLQIAELYADNEAMAEDLSARDVTISQLRLELSAARARADALRSAKEMTWRSAEELEYPVRADALTLLELGATTPSGWLSRDAGGLERLQWDRKRWEAADQFLLTCGAIVRNRKHTRVHERAVELVNQWGRAEGPKE